LFSPNSARDRIHSSTVIFFSGEESAPPTSSSLLNTSSASPFSFSESGKKIDSRSTASHGVVEVNAARVDEDGGWFSASDCCALRGVEWADSSTSSESARCMTDLRTEDTEAAETRLTSGVGVGSNSSAAGVSSTFSRLLNSSSSTSSSCCSSCCASSSSSASLSAISKFLSNAPCSDSSCSSSSAGCGSSVSSSITGSMTVSGSTSGSGSGSGSGSDSIFLVFLDLVRFGFSSGYFAAFFGLVGSSSTTSSSASGCFSSPSLQLPAIQTALVQAPLRCRTGSESTGTAYMSSSTCEGSCRVGY
ncbi:hypothetical protein KCV00_g50, partial [Aureobasidium melanogenum]